MCEKIVELARGTLSSGDRFPAKRDRGSFFEKKAINVSKAGIVVDKLPRQERKRKKRPITISEISI